jgi:hypothetical protein
MARNKVDPYLRELLPHLYTEINMKKSVLFAIMAASIGLGVSQMATAGNPSLVPFFFHCPVVAASGTHVLLNDGAKISGYGSEKINKESTSNNPYFSGAISVGANIPGDLTTGGYANSGTSYDPQTGMVTCSYTSSTTFDPFSVQYAVTGGLGGMVTTSTVDELTFKKFLGVKA